MLTRLFLIIVFGACSFLSLQAAVDTGGYKIDIRRVKLHEDIDKLQAALLSADGKKDKFIDAVLDKDVNLALTDIMIRQVDVLQDSLETTTTLDHRLKVKYLTALLQFVRVYHTGWTQQILAPENGLILFAEFSELMEADMKGRSIEPIVAKYPYGISDLLLNGRNNAFSDNKGFNASRIELFRKFSAIYPSRVLAQLENYADVPFADSLIRITAKQDPNQFYDYAAATETKVGQLIQKCQDPLVKAIAGMAASNSGRLYYPFLDEVMNGRQSIASIQQVMTDSLKYYRLLVNTQISYTKRLVKGDTALAFSDLTKMLQRKAVEVFINQINALHDDPDAVRFKILEPLTPQELYYLIVLGEDVIYTSSYKGAYKRMMERMRVPSGDTLLMSIQFDKFKKFIKMAAGYNTLESFLATMPDANAQRLMIAFARGLEKTGQLEEAVDVADSYGSIQIPQVKSIIDKEVAVNLENSIKRGDKRSERIYRILKTIFESSSDPKLDLSKLLGIPPVYTVDYNKLADAEGKVVQLVFFYGDKDGIDSYANFMSMFNGSAEWKVTKLKEWVEIRSAKGKPVIIYANLPLDNSNGDDPDALAQEHLIQYLNKLNIRPTVVIHRGHSYHVKYTIKQLPASAKIVILGSCGGYHNLDDVLKISPDAHIISSKEVGTRVVNEPILRHINDDLKAGRGIDWIGTWKDLTAMFPTGEARERFENYIPPHKNLGALFIKAYNQLAN